MLNGVGNNEDLNNSQLSGQLGINSIGGVSSSNPYKNVDKSLFIDETAISDEAINLYEHEQDVKQFTKLAMSNPDNLSHDEILSGLFSKGISDLFSDESLESLSDNQNLLSDLTSVEE